MAKNNISTRKGQKASKPRVQHSFTMREIVQTNATTSTVLQVSTNASGVATGQIPFNPAGISGSAYTAGSSFAAGSVVDTPHLRWLFNQCQNFGYYRVTRAKLIFVGNLGSTTQGQLNLAGYRDVMDTGVALATAYVQGKNAKVIDLATLSRSESSLQLPVDSSWKKVTNLTTVPGNNVPFIGNAQTLISVNSVNDLCFSSFSYQVIGGPASTVIGNFFLDYDVEFRDPESQSVNL